MQNQRLLSTQGEGACPESGRWESNPTIIGVGHRDRTVLASAEMSLQSSHPLESNQILSGFSRARGPLTLGWDERTAWSAGTVLEHHAVRVFVKLLFGCQRGVRRSGRIKAHLGRSALEAFLERSYLDSRS